MSGFAALKERLAGSLWFIPSVMVVAAILLALLTTRADAATEHRPFTQLIFQGGPDSARDILQTVANAVITFTALVFTITIVALQLSSQQFSPRVLRTFLRDRQSKVALGTFIATFIYCLVVLRVISADDDRGVTIPSISMMVLLLLTLTSVAMFVSYISHMANSVRVSQIIASVGDETRRVIATLPEPDEASGRDRGLLDTVTTHRVRAAGQGTLTRIYHGHLVSLAAEGRLAIVFTRGVGDFIAEGQVIAEVKGGEVSDEEVWERLSVGVERGMKQDPQFGLRQLVDIAAKALSPSLNDPTTAVMSLDQIHDLLRRLADRPFHSGEHVDDREVVRLVAPALSWESLVELALVEIRQLAASSPQVLRRLVAVLDDLDEVVPPERHEVLRLEREAIESQVRSTMDDERDRRLALTGDQRGLGGGR